MVVSARWCSTPSPFGSTRKARTPASVRAGTITRAADCAAGTLNRVPSRRHAAPSARAVSHDGDVRFKVLDYLERQILADDPQRQNLLALAARFLDDGGTP